MVPVYPATKSILGALATKQEYIHKFGWRHITHLYTHIFTLIHIKGQFSLSGQLLEKFFLDSDIGWNTC